MVWATWSGGRGSDLEEFARKLKRALHTELPDERRWIPVEERLPPKDEMFIGKGPHRRAYAVLAWEPHHACYAAAWDNWPLEEFNLTHWMPLPEPPNDD